MLTHGSRFSLAAAVVAVAFALSVAPASGVTDDDNYDRRNECTEYQYKTWGANCDGWHVFVTNKSGQTLQGVDRIAGITRGQFGISQYFSSVENGQTSGEILGSDTPSGPANMRIALTKPDGSLWGISINSVWRGGARDVYVRCGRLELRQAPDAIEYLELEDDPSCTVVEQTLTKPLVVQFNRPEN